MIDRLTGPLDDVARVLMQEAAVGIAILDRRGVIVRVNACLQLMVGDVSPGRLVATLFCASQECAVWGEIEPVLQGARPPGKFTARLATGSASAITAEVTAVVLREEDGRISGLALTLVDISAQVRLEAQRMQGQRLQAVGELAAGVAHDFNNLLTAIIGAADDVLARGMVDPDSIEDVRQIRSSADRGADLVRQVLDFGRPQAVQPRALGIDDAVRGLAALLRRLLGPDVVLELGLGAPGVAVRIDPSQLDQVLVNLTVNARNSMKAGGRLSVRTSLVVLEQGEAAIPPGPYAQLEVQDTGSGIPAAVLSRIFDRFFTTRPDQGGTGLGLSTVQGIIQRAGGVVTAESQEGHGTRFRIYFPPCEPLCPPALQRPAFVAEARKVGAVLLVDDDAALRHLASRALRTQGWTVLAADSGEAALALLQGAAAVGFLVSDASMPGMDGLALVCAARAVRPGLPAILMSGYSEGVVRGVREAEQVIFLAKPCTMQALVAAVEALASGAAEANRNETGPDR